MIDGQEVVFDRPTGPEDIENAVRFPHAVQAVRSSGCFRFSTLQCPSIHSTHEPLM